VAALAYGASGYMTKPFKPEALLESMNAVLGIA
jgi:DNA-binding response OmpR family regulator